MEDQIHYLLTQKSTKEIEVKKVPILEMSLMIEC